MTNPEISVVIPLHDEADNVFPLVEKVIGAFDKLPGGFELILVDDASTDSTWDRLNELRQKDPRVRLGRHNAQGGQSKALWTGFKAGHGQIIATLDGDLQNDPADLVPMLEILKTCDMVVAVRTRRADTWLRRFSTWVARWARRLVLRVNFADTGCNLRVFRREVLETIPPFNGFHRFMPILAHSGGAVVREFPVTHHPRLAGRSKYGVWNRLWRGIFDLVMVAMYLRRQLKLDGRKDYERTQK